jgi:alanine dehydrogenase
MNDGVLILTRSEVAGVMQFPDYLEAVELAFRLYATGQIPGSGILDVPGKEGTFHIKAAAMPVEDAIYVAVKVNGNFPHNKERFGLPIIQGAILLCDGIRGCPLALLDSTEITIGRTGAATALAAKHLARNNSRTATICGCGNQGRIQLTALKSVLPIKRVFAWDQDQNVADRFCREMADKLEIPVTPVHELKEAVKVSDVIVTCTTSKQAFIHKKDVPAGVFIAAVGADHHEKQEIDPHLMAAGKVVADIREQCARMGDLHHAIRLGLIGIENIHGELGEIVCGQKKGRESDEETIIFDSTGTAIQDVASAVIAYRRALRSGAGSFSNLLAP